MARNNYQFETSPRKLQPDYEPKNNPYKKKKTTTRKKEKVEAKPKQKRKLKPNAKVILYIAIGFSMLFTISFRNSIINENFNKKEDLKKELSLVQKENEQLKVSIENSLNLNLIEQAAKEKLGMQKLNDRQKVYVRLPKKDYVEPASEEVVVDSDSSWLGQIIEKLTN